LALIIGLTSGGYHPNQALTLGPTVGANCSYTNLGTTVVRQLLVCISPI